MRILNHDSKYGILDRVYAKSRRDSWFEMRNSKTPLDRDLRCASQITNLDVIWRPHGPKYRISNRDSRMRISNHNSKYALCRCVKTVVDILYTYTLGEDGPYKLQWRIYGGGGGGLGGLNPPPPLGLPSKKFNVHRKTPSLCPDPHSMFLGYSTLSQAQPQTIGFNPPPPPPPPPPPLGCQVNMWYVHRKNAIMWLVDARKTSLTGVQNSKKNRVAATRLGHRLCIEKRHHAVSRCQENITYGGSK